MAQAAPSERAFLEAFFVWIYTARAHADGTVGQIIDETLAFPHRASVEAIQTTIDAAFNARVDAFWCEIEGCA